MTHGLETMARLNELASKTQKPRPVDEFELYRIVGEVYGRMLKMLPAMSNLLIRNELDGTLSIEFSIMAKYINRNANDNRRLGARVNFSNDYIHLATKPSYIAENVVGDWMRQLNGFAES